MSWEYSPEEAGWGAGITAWRRLEARQNKGGWNKVHETLLSRSYRADEISSERRAAIHAALMALGCIILTRNSFEPRFV
jgi:hypothetical protein